MYDLTRFVEKSVKREVRVMKQKLLVPVLGLLVVSLTGLVLADSKEDALGVYRKWLQCLASKGEDHEDCLEFFQGFIGTAYQRLEELKAEHRGGADIRLQQN